MSVHDSLTGMVCLAVRITDLSLPIPPSLPLGALSFFLAWLPVWIVVAVALLFWLCFRWIPNDRIGVVEKWWSLAGSVTEGRIIAPAAEAGYQADILRGGLHFGWWRWQYAIHIAPLVSIPEGKIGYVFARDGEPLPPSQTLARVVDCNNFQDARGFLGLKAATDATASRIAGQKGRQRAILREGVYAINPALFTVISENAVFALKIVQTRAEQESLGRWLAELRAASGFGPVVVGKGTAVAAIPDHDAAVVAAELPVDSLAIVTVHDGPSLAPGEIIAPTVGGDLTDANYHNNYQDPEAFLLAGGRRGRQHMPLTDGTYFVNRWFATVEMIPKTVVPIGSVGVVVSYIGRTGNDISGATFRHGERVAEGERGVWERTLGPGKYAFNTYSGNVVLVPTTNFVLHWVTGRSESHRYDESLKSIDLVTKDAYEPSLPLSVVVHIDYQRAPSVIQRFGDVQRLITQTLDPMLSAYFRDVAHKKTMLELLHDRDLIQAEARNELHAKFHEFDIECVAVLIGKPETGKDSGKIEMLLDQLRERQLSVEQLETFERKRVASEKMRLLAEAQALATMQTQLTNARVEAQIAEQQGEADLFRARKSAEQMVVMAEAELSRSRLQAEQHVLLAEAAAKQKDLEGRGEGQKVMQIGLSEAAVQLKKISSYGDPRLYALTLVADSLATSVQPLVPQRLFVSGGGEGKGDQATGQGMLGLLINLLVAEKSGLGSIGIDEADPLKRFADRMSEQVLESMADPNTSETRPVDQPAGA
ncbi:MAG: SPFH domain-containing protein [Planctomycetota bacterium]|nr:SPFH domain-containing protein [Planctomycetota bacterium]